MFNSIKVIADNKSSKLYIATLWNILLNMFKGAPYGILFLVLVELFQPLTSQNQINTPVIMVLILGLIISLFVQFFVGKRAYEKSYKTSYNLSANARLNLGEHLRKLPLNFFKSRDPGDITALLLQDMTLVEQIFSHMFPDFVSAIVLSVLLGLFLLFADWRLAVAMILSVMIALIFLLLSLRLIRYFAKIHIQSRNNSVSRMMEYLLGIKVLKSNNQTGTKFERLEIAFDKLKRDSILMEGVPSPLIYFYWFILEIGYILMLILGTYFTVNGTLDTVTFLLFIIIGYAFYDPLKNIAIFVGEMRYMTIASERIVSVLKTKILPEPENDSKIDHFDIEFRNVNFKYRDSNVINNISFHIPEKSVTALVGPSGSGKTTLTSLIARFWDVNSGEVLIGGKNIKDLKNETLLSYISMVFQDVYLFNDTIYNNIKIGKSNATEEEIFESAKTANCHEFIQQLPYGYNTLVGEGGSTLSGGEKQRISIARAILKDAPIILLDEATASLDPENEDKIQEAIRELVKSKTVLVIAHRLYALSDADQIIVIENGQVVEQGQHQELINNQSTYWRLWEEQQRAHGWKFGLAKD